MAEQWASGPCQSRSPGPAQRQGSTELHPGQYLQQVRGWLALCRWNVVCRWSPEHQL